MGNDTWTPRHFQKNPNGLEQSPTVSRACPKGCHGPLSPTGASYAHPRRHWGAVSYTHLRAHETSAHL
eukprot:2804793-Alexandrium_andersonii.AAC.1